MFLRILKRLFVILVLLWLIFVIYDYINPDWASILVDKVKDAIPEKIVNYFDSSYTWWNDISASWDTIITWTTISIVTWDVTREDTSNNQNLATTTWNSSIEKSLDDNLTNTIVSGSAAKTWNLNTWNLSSWNVVSTWNMTVTKTIVPPTTNWGLSQKDINDARNLMNNIIK